MSLPDPAVVVRSMADTDPTRLAVVARSERVSYGRLAELADQAAASLSRIGVGPGTLVELPLRATVEGIARLLAVHALGGIPLPTAGGEPAVEPCSADVLVVVSTSGSSGEPRRVPLTAHNIGAAVDASRRRLGTDAEDRWLLCLPLHHVGGLSVLWRSFAAGGAVVAVDGFDRDVVAEALDTEATVASLVPTMAHRLLESTRVFRRVRFALLGGGPADRRLVEASLGAGLALLQTYGMTEASSQVATVAPGEIEESLGTVGRPLPGMEVSIVDDEIFVDGPAVFGGYFGASPRVGPHPTGDLGHLDDGGRLVVTGRKDDVVITGGEKVHPARIEAVLEAHPDVTGAVVLGLGDPEWGQRLVAVVEGDVVESSLRTWLADRVARHEVPKRITLAADLPRLESGKVDREAARTLAR